MPAVSSKQRIVAAIAEHHPEKLYSRNKGMAKMSKGQLHDYASTKDSKLPSSVSKASSKISKMSSKMPKMKA